MLKSIIPMLALFTAIGGSALHGDDGGRFRAYVGTYTQGESEGIYTFEFDARDGSVSEVSLAAKSKNPSFVALHPSGKFLYAVAETDEFDGSGALASYRIAPATGKLTLLNTVSSHGAGPCHLVVDAAGRFVLAANYGGGSVCSTAIEPDGRLGEAASVVQHEGSSVNPQRQSEPHAHSINLDQANRFAVAADLGIDKVLVYRFDAETGRLTANDPPATNIEPGSGPRHFAFHPSGRFAYVINELALTVTVFAYDAEAGTLTPRQTISTVPDGPQPGYSTAEIVAHPSGKFVYGSNRGHHSIAMFQVDAEDGRLRFLGTESTRGETPRNFAVDPTGRYLFAENQGTDTIVVFRINADTGRLSETGTVIPVPSPVCLRMQAMR